MKKVKGFKLQIIPYSEIRDLGISERIKKVLKLIMDDKVVILQGRLRAEEEIRLIEDTMSMVDHVKKFKGIELAVIEPDSNKKSIFVSIKRNIAKTLVGDHGALTIIGPASIVKEVKRDPSKIEVLLG